MNNDDTGSFNLAHMNRKLRPPLGSGSGTRPSTGNLVRALKGSLKATRNRCF